MEIKTFIKKTLCTTCVIFTLVTLFYSLVVLFLNVDAEQILLDGSRIILFLLFSFFVAFANSVLKINAMPLWTRYVIHFMITAFAFFLCILHPVSESAAPSFVLVGLVLFTIAYLVIAALVALFKSRYKRISEIETAEKYSKQFTK